MPAPLAVDKEAVRVLVVAVGVREAAARMKLPPGTVAAWSARGKWLEGKAELADAISGAPSEAKSAIACTLPPSMRPVVPESHASGAIKPADALAEVLADRHAKTRLGQSKYLARASEKLAEVDDEELLLHAPTGKALADMAGKVWPEQATPSVRLSIFATDITATVERNVIDVEQA